MDGWMDGLSDEWRCCRLHGYFTLIGCSDDSSVYESLN